MIHVGVDLHQRFCYMTAMEARGKVVQAGPVTNERAAASAVPSGLVKTERNITPGIPLVDPAT